MFRELLGTVGTLCYKRSRNGIEYSSLMLRRLKGDMYLVSHDGLVHVSPEDVTSRKYYILGGNILLSILTLERLRTFHF